MVSLFEAAVEDAVFEVGSEAGIPWETGEGDGLCGFGFVPIPLDITGLVLFGNQYQACGVVRPGQEEFEDTQAIGYGCGDVCLAPFERADGMMVRDGSSVSADPGADEVPQVFPGIEGSMVEHEMESFRKAVHPTGESIRADDAADDVMEEAAIGG